MGLWSKREVLKLKEISDLEELPQDVLKDLKDHDQKQISSMIALLKGLKM